MRRRFFLAKSVAFLFATFLGLPAPLYALRDKAAAEKDPETVSGLEEALRKPSATLKRLADFVIPRPSDPDQTTPSAAAVPLRPPAEKLPGGGAPPAGGGLRAPGLGLGRQMQQMLPFSLELTVVEPPQAAYNPVEGRLYVLQPDEERVVGYDALTGKPTGFEIETPGRPRAIAAEPETGRLLILSDGPEGLRLQRFEPGTNQWVPPAVPIPGSPGGIALEPGTEVPFVLILDNPPLPVPLPVEGPQTPAVPQPSGRIQRFDLAAGLPAGPAFGNLAGPSAVAYDPVRRRLLVAEEAAGRVVGLEARTGRPILEIKGLNRPNSVALSADGRWIFVTERSPGRLVAFDAATGQPAGLAVEGFRSPRIEAVNPADQTLFISETIPQAQGDLSWRLRVLSQADGRPLQGVPAPAALLPVSAAVPSPPAAAGPAGMEEKITPDLLKRIADGLLQNNRTEPLQGGPVRFLTPAQVHRGIPKALAAGSAEEQKRIERIFRTHPFNPAGLIAWIGVPSGYGAERYWKAAAPLLEAAPGVIEALAAAAGRSQEAPLSEAELAAIADREIVRRKPVLGGEGKEPPGGVSEALAWGFVVRTALVLNIPVSLRPAGAEETAAFPHPPAGIVGPGPVSPEAPVPVTEAAAFLRPDRLPESGVSAAVKTPAGERSGRISPPVLQRLESLPPVDRRLLSDPITRLIRAMDRRGIEPSPLFEEMLLAALKNFPPDQIRLALELAAELLKEKILPEAVLLGLPALSEAGGGKTAEFRSNLPVLKQLLIRLRESAGEEGSVTVPAQEIASLTLEAIRLTREGLDYGLEVSGRSAPVVNPPSVEQPAAPAPAVRLISRPPGAGAMLPPTAGGIQIGPERAALVALRSRPLPSIADLAEELAALLPSAGTAREPIRFIVDTDHVRPGQGDTRVLHLAQLAVWLRQKNPNAFIDVAGVATAAELRMAEDQLPDPVSRNLLAGRILTYEPLDNASHRQALALLEQAFPLFKDLPPQQVIRRIDTATLRGFLDALYHLGIRDLSQELWDKIEATLTSI